MIVTGQPFEIECRRPILAVRFPRPQRMLSWSVLRPGFTVAPSVAWLEVADADLPVGRDPIDLLRRRLAEVDLDDAIGLMTACDVRSYRMSAETVEDVTATVVTTVGLGNGEFVGHRRLTAPSFAPPPRGTINTLVHVSVPLAESAMVETIAIAAQARTVAVLEATLRRGGDIVTGTGSDCIVVASPPGDGLRYAGLHTAVGEAVGAAVAEVTRGAISCWFRDTSRTARATKTIDEAPPLPRLIRARGAGRAMR